MSHNEPIDKPQPAGRNRLPVLDRLHLSRYTLQNQELEREIVDLFLAQLPALLDMLRTAATPADWKLGTHTLKGSAAAVGAARIRETAQKLEAQPFGATGPEVENLMVELDAAVVVFRKAVRRIYG